MTAPPDQTMKFGLPPLRSAEDTWTLRGPLVRKNGELWMDLREVTQATYTVRLRHARGGGRIERKRLVVSSMHRSRSVYVDYVAAGRTHRSSWVGAHELMVAVLERIGVYAPEARIRFGAGSALRWLGFAWMTFLCFVALTATLALAVHQAPAAFFVAVVTLLLLVMTWWSRPWSGGSQWITATEAAAQIAAQPPLRRRGRPRHF